MAAANKDRDRLQYVKIGVPIWMVEQMKLKYPDEPLSTAFRLFLTRVMNPKGGIRRDMAKEENDA